jgi:hypothetical protein
MPIIFWAPRGVATAKIRNMVIVVPPPLLVVSQALKEVPGEREQTLSDYRERGGG